jgi:subtilisin
MPAKKSGTRRYVILPLRGLTDRILTSLPREAASTHTLAARATVAGAGGKGAGRPAYTLVRSMSEDGPKLIEASEEAVLALRLEHPNVRVVPEMEYRRLVVAPADVADRRFAALRGKGKPARGRRAKAAKAGAKVAKLATGAGGVGFEVTSATEGTPIVGARVMVYVKELKNAVEGVTNAAGKVRVKLPSSATVIGFIIESQFGFWSVVQRVTSLANPTKIALKRLDLSVPDVLRAIYTGRSATDGKGVRVGIIDSGVDGTHPDLRVNATLSKNMTGVEPATQWGPSNDAEGEHGTHVAGIIAGLGKKATHMRGQAAGAEIVSYRVFADKGKNAKSFAIAHAIRAAAQDECDVVNMSLGLIDPNTGESTTNVDPTIEEALAFAEAHGVLCIIAAGNSNRAPVGYPALSPHAVAVTAMGKKGTYPPDSIDKLNEAPPTAKTDPKFYIASFSNVGDDADVTGPGVAVISTVPGGYAAMSGTSMACPAVTGFAARLLAAHATILKMARTTDRSRAIRKMVFESAKPQGFGRKFEGFGLPLP